MKQSLEAHAPYFKPFLKKATTERVVIGPLDKGRAVKLRVALHAYRAALREVDPDLYKALYRCIVRLEPTDVDSPPGSYNVVGEPRDLELAPLFEKAGILPEEIDSEEESKLWGDLGVDWGT